MTYSADVIIDEIDTGRLLPMTHAVVRAMHEHMALSDRLQREAVAAFDRKEQPANLRDTLWGKMLQLDVTKQSGFRLSNCLLRPDKPVDWYLAEYLIQWAREEGLSEQHIVEAFHSA